MISLLSKKFSFLNLFFKMLEASMPVPLYYWSLVKTKAISMTNNTASEEVYSDSDSEDDAVVIVSINNPYLKVRIGFI